MAVPGITDVFGGRIDRTLPQVKTVTEREVPGGVGFTDVTGLFDVLRF